MRTADGEDGCSQMSTEVAWKPKCWHTKSLGTEERKEKKERQGGTETRELENCNGSMRQAYKTRKWKHWKFPENTAKKDRKKI